MAGAVTGIPEGRATETIYGLIRDGKHDECAKLWLTKSDSCVLCGAAWS